MPNTKSAKKRLKQNQTQRTRNRAIRSNLRTHVRKVRDAVAAGNIEEAEQVFRLAAQR
ncbi:MAG: 30S ribosomal protein S20, partial [Pirellulaceae bacterium]